MNRDLLFITFIASLGGFLLGFDYSVLHDTGPFTMPYFGLNPSSQWGSISAGLGGSVFGAYFIGRPADRFGRRDMMKFVAALFIVGAIGSGLATHFIVFVLFRFIAGLSIGAASVLVPVYLSEIAPPKLRGRLVSAFPLAILLGALCAYCSDKLLFDTGANNWRLMYMSGSVPAFLFLILLFRTLRTPRWLIKKGHDKEASFVIHLVNPQADIDQFMKTIKDHVMVEKKGRTIKLLKKPYLKIVLIVALFGMFTQFTGVNLLVYYLKDISFQLGLIPDPTVGVTAIIAMTSLIFTIISMFFIDKAGRKLLVIYGTVLLAILVAVLGILFLMGSTCNLLLFLLILIATGVFAASQGIVIWVYISEVIPDRIRARASSFAFSSYWFFNLLTALLCPVVTGFGKGILLLLFAAITIGSLFFFRKYLADTKGKSLEALEDEILS
jgi:sugar porter (SP) family MFS transporter